MKNPVLAAAVGGLLLTGACAAPFQTQVQTQADPESPLSDRVQALVDAHREYPRWEDFPDAPTDVPQPQAVAAQVAGLDRAGQALDRSVAAIDWALSDDPNAWAASVRDRVAGARMSVGTARTAAEIDAFARSLRERSEPPPPIDPRR